MADNVAYTPGTGATIAADDVSGVLYQRIKPAFGADGAAVDVARGAGLPLSDCAANYSASGTVGGGNTDLVSLDASGYRRFSFQLTGTFTGVSVLVQGSNDGTTWITLPFDSLTSTTVVQYSSATGTGLWGGAINCRYWRLRLNSISTGTVTATVELSALPYQPVAAGIFASGSAALSVVPKLSSASAVTSVAQSMSVGTLLATNFTRVGFAVFNDTGMGVLFLKLGASASLTSHTVQIIAGGYYELCPVMPYQGQVTGLWDVTGSGSARITEWTI